MECHLLFLFSSIPAGLTLAGVTHRLPNGRTLNDQPMILGITWGLQQVARNCQKTCQPKGRSSVVTPEKVL